MKSRIIIAYFFSAIGKISGGDWVEWEMEFQGEIHQPTEEDVILKIKDEGDFDSLRLKIIKKLKENVILQLCFFFITPFVF